jgi:hypothetical protein
MSLITNSRRLFVIAAVLAGRCLVAFNGVSSDAPPTARRLGPGPRPGTRVMEGYRLVEAAAPEQANGTISLAFDEQASLFTCSSRRVGICVPDNRLNSYWIEDDLAARTVADREAKYRKYASRVKGGFEVFLSESDVVRKLIDRDGDGVYETATVFADGFATPVTNIGSGLFALDGTVYYSNIPDLWSLRDTDGDGVADVRHSLLSGFGVRDCFFGHDLNALVLAPDGPLSPHERRGGGHAGERRHADRRALFVVRSLHARPRWAAALAAEPRRRASAERQRRGHGGEPPDHRRHGRGADRLPGRCVRGGDRRRHGGRSLDGAAGEDRTAVNSPEIALCGYGRHAAL